MPGLESREYGRRDPFRWPRNTLYPQKLTLTSPTSHSVGVVRLRTQATGFLKETYAKIRMYTPSGRFLLAFPTRTLHVFLISPERSHLQVRAISWQVMFGASRAIFTSWVGGGRAASCLAHFQSCNRKDTVHSTVPLSSSKSIHDCQLGPVWDTAACLLAAFHTRDSGFTQLYNTFQLRKPCLVMRGVYRQCGTYRSCFYFKQACLTATKHVAVRRGVYRQCWTYRSCFYFKHVAVRRGVYR
jgi:hypothetical protein